MRHCRVTVSLPIELLEAIDAGLTRPDETRSAVFRRLAEEALQRTEERAEVERWVRAYRDEPPTTADDAWAALGPRNDPSAVPWE